MLQPACADCYGKRGEGNGPLATAMPSFGSLDDEEIWQLVIYLRSLANGH